MRAAWKKRVLILVLISLAGFTSLLLLQSTLSHVTPVDASLFVKITNEGNQTRNSLTLNIFVESEPSMDFTNVSIEYLGGEDFTVRDIKNGSGIQVSIERFRPGESIEFQVNNIIVNSTIDLSSVTLWFSETNLNYDMDLAIYGKVNSLRFSIANFYVSRKIQKGTSYFDYKYRKKALDYLKILYIAIILLIVGINLKFIEVKGIRRFPYVTLMVIALVTGVYVFIGSGIEVNLMSWARNYRCFFAPVSFLFHGYDRHISTNLIYFALVSTLIESWLGFKRKSKEFIFWYLIPLTADSLFVNTPYSMSTGYFGFGLSLAIEAMTWSLWTYIIKNYDKVLKRRVDAFMVLLSGIPSYVFFGWLLEYLLHSVGIVKLSPYQLGLAILHVGYGVLVIAFIILILMVKTIRYLGDFSDTAQA